jgi:hypothetical protein
MEAPRGYTYPSLEQFVGKPKVDVIGTQQQDMVQTDAAGRMDEAKKMIYAVPLTWASVGICCFWLPLCCFLAAANVLPTCEKIDVLIGEDQHMGDFIKVYSLILVLSGPVMQTLIACCAYSGSRILYKHAAWMNVVTCLIQLLLMIQGWRHYANTSDENCYDGDGEQDHYINPRTLLFGILLGQAILSGLEFCFYCGVLGCGVGVVAAAQAEGPPAVEGQA